MALSLVLVPALLLPVSAPGANGSTRDQEAVPRYRDDALRELVARYTVDGGEGVDYRAWKAAPDDVRALRDHVDLIARVSPKRQPEQFPTRASRRSYWINSYNALVLAGVLEYWPIESVRDVKLSFISRLIPGKGFFYDHEVVVGGETTNLYDLEKEILARHEDPRLHFALNCASVSCPVLRVGDWTDDALERAARRFVNDPANVSVAGGDVYLSEIFKWYRRDFPPDLLVWLQQYAEPPLKASLQAAVENGYRRRYRRYDWSLNDSREQQAGAHG